MFIPKVFGLPHMNGEYLYVVIIVDGVSNFFYIGSIMAEYSRVFIYLSAFGLSDLVARHYITSFQTRIIYYVILGLLGVYLTR